MAVDLLAQLVDVVFVEADDVIVIRGDLVDVQRTVLRVSLSSRA